MHAPFRLPNGQAGSYDWSSLTIRLGAFTLLKRKTVIQAIAAFEKSRRATWKNGGEARAIICLFHELTHLGQDMFTGAGMHDFIVLRTELPQLLYAGKTRTSLPARSGITDSYAADALQKCNSQLLVDCFRSGYARRDDQVITSLRRVESTISDKDARSFQLRNLLEADAVAATWLNFREIVGTPVQREILEEPANRAMFHPLKMGPDYRDLFEVVLSYFDKLFGAPANLYERRYGIDATLILAAKLIRVLVDLSLGFPSPRLMESRQIDSQEYEPSVRFLRYLRAWTALPGAETLAATAILLGENNYEKIERYLLTTCSYAYLPQRLIYEDWRDYLSDLNSKQKDSEEYNYILPARLQAAQLRVADPVEWWSPEPHSLLWSNIPIYFQTVDNMFSYGSGPDVVDKETVFNTFEDINRHMRDIRLAAHLLEGDLYCCPFAEAHVCEAANADCINGMEVLKQQLPQDPECSVRHALLAAEFDV
jgi:hypothetical protein